jgi:hypothetical protein
MAAAGLIAGLIAVRGVHLSGHDHASAGACCGRRQTAASHRMNVQSQVSQSEECMALRQSNGSHHINASGAAVALPQQIGASAVAVGTLTVGADGGGCNIFCCLLC